jgi:hypothetical protein
MSKTLGALKVDVLRRLGDSTGKIWKLADIARYLNEGYERLAVMTGLLWDTVYLEDQSYAGSHTADWEVAEMPAGFQVLNQFHYTADWEAEYAFTGQLQFGPANHTTLWEFDNGYQVTDHFVAVHKLDPQVIEIERAVSNKRRIEPLRSRELEFSDGQYQTLPGEVLGYIRDKDGPRSFRKWRIPASAADEYTVTTDSYAANYTGSWETAEVPDSFVMLNQFAFTQAWEEAYADADLQSIAPSGHTALWEYTQNAPFGLLRIPTDISAETVIGERGIARRIPGEHPAAGDGARGFPRRVWRPSKNTKIEYTKKGKFLTHDSDEFEFPDLYVKYIRHFALYRALGRGGQGQDLQLSAFWKGMWEAGVQRARRRKQNINKTRRHVLGGGPQELKRPPLARLPWQFGRSVR